MDMGENITSLAAINIGSSAASGDTRRVLSCDRHMERIRHEVKCLVTDMSHVNVKIT